MKYTVDYFIKKFKAIPANKWCIAKLKNDKGQKCALGHCRVKQKNSGAWIYGKEGDALDKVLSGLTWAINDGLEREYKQFKSPRTRILKALNKVKKGTFTI